MTKRNSWIHGASATVMIAAALTLGAAQAHAAATSAPTVPPVQMHVQPIQEPLAPCPPGTGIMVAPAGVPPFTAQSVAFETSSVLSVDSMAARAGGRVKIVKLSDASSESLIRAEQKSTVLSTVTITFHKSQAAEPSNMIVTLSDVTVVTIDEQRTTMGAHETVTLAYRKLARTNCRS
jgi:hypothetical protein